MYSYRIAREKRWYRVALCKNESGNYTTNADSHYDNGCYIESFVEEYSDFVRWLTPRIEYEVD